jgi:hypothetical protein
VTARSPFASGARSYGIRVVQVAMLAVAVRWTRLSTRDGVATKQEI